MVSEESYIQQLFAERIGGKTFGKSTEIYKFEKIKRAKRAALAAHPDGELIDLGVGEPDEMAFPLSVRALGEEAAKPENRGYADNGGPEFRRAAVHWMERVFNVAGLNPDTEIIHSIGSKAALSILPAALVNPGDVVLMTVPGYPVFGTHARWYGGEVFSLKLTEERDFLPDLDSVPKDVLPRAKVLVLNYPNNPTGASATTGFFERAVEFAKRNKLVVISDAAYAALVFHGKPLSILSVPGAKGVAIELHSMSKAFNMTGWRLGFVCGNPLLVAAYGSVKDNTDSGQFLAIQKACAATLAHPEITHKIAAKYSRRMDLLVACLRKFGFDAHKPNGSFFLYVRAPKAASGRAFKSAEDVSQWLITEKLISTVPWDDAGAYLRLSVTFVAKNEADERRVVKEIENRLAGVKFEFS
ncbi:MAG TPA: LL-diaminopimelate aminotransferase [Verrucomicrobiae bacterium]|nr:LL-diaminopimelate aminotransferase [Verrucomicrobiae bacterium]